MHLDRGFVWPVAVHRAYPLRYVEYRKLRLGLPRKGRVTAEH